MVAVPYNETVEGKIICSYFILLQSGRKTQKANLEEKRRPRVVQAWSGEKQAHI